MAEPTQNVDHYEIGKFEELAARWWDPNSEFKPLHDINPLRLDYVDAATGLNGKQALDVGCGGGLLSESMAARGARVTGIDLGQKPLQVAELHSLESGIQVTYRRIAVEKLAEETPAAFDIVTCMELLEHVPQPASVISACAKLVKPGGAVFFSTLNRNTKSYLLAILGAEYILGMLPRGTHDYSRFIKPSEMDVWARAAGMHVTDITGITYNPLTDTYRLSPRDVDVNYMMTCRLDSHA